MSKNKKNQRKRRQHHELEKEEDLEESKGKYDKKQTNNYLKPNNAPENYRRKDKNKKNRKHEGNTEYQAKRIQNEAKGRQGGEIISLKSSLESPPHTGPTIQESIELSESDPVEFNNFFSRAPETKPNRSAKNSKKHKIPRQAYQRNTRQHPHAEEEAKRNNRYIEPQKHPQPAQNKSQRHKRPETQISIEEETKVDLRKKKEIEERSQGSETTIGTRVNTARSHLISLLNSEEVQNQDNQKHSTTKQLDSKTKPNPKPDLNIKTKRMGGRINEVYEDDSNLEAEADEEGEREGSEYGKGKDREEEEKEVSIGGEISSSEETSRQIAIKRRNKRKTLTKRELLNMKTHNRYPPNQHTHFPYYQNLSPSFSSPSPSSPSAIQSFSSSFASSSSSVYANQIPKYQYNIVNYLHKSKLFSNANLYAINGLLPLKDKWRGKNYINSALQLEYAEYSVKDLVHNEKKLSLDVLFNERQRIYNVFSDHFEGRISLNLIDLTIEQVLVDLMKFKTNQEMRGTEVIKKPRTSNIQTANILKQAELLLNYAKIFNNELKKEPMVKLEKKFLNKDIKLKELFPPKVKDNYYQVEYKRTGRNFIKQSVGSKIINKYSQYFKDLSQEVDDIYKIKKKANEEITLPLIKLEKLTKEEQTPAEIKYHNIVNVDAKVFIKAFLFPQ